MNSKNKDFILSLLCGFLAGIFLLAIVKNPYVTEFKGLNNLGGVVWLLPLLFAFLFFLAIAIAKTLFRRVLFLMQIGKFAESGVLNTLIDIGILNLLSWWFNIFSGPWLIIMNIVAFAFATTNSYFWNKFWTFEKKESAANGEFITFFIVSVIGIGINTSIVYFGTTFMDPLLNVSNAAWLDVVKVGATFASMIWNFAGYKFIVFKK